MLVLSLRLKMLQIHVCGTKNSEFSPSMVPGEAAVETGRTGLLKAKLLTRVHYEQNTHPAISGSLKVRRRTSCRIRNVGIHLGRKMLPG